MGEGISLKIGILILNRNGKDWLSPLYESIRVNGYPNVRVYLVDNASDDGSVETTLGRCPEVTVICLARNMGYCMAYNLAMPYAFADGCEWVIWANNDIRLEPGCLEALASTARSDNQIGVLGPAFLAWDGDEPNHYMRGNHPGAIQALKAKASGTFDVDWVEGSFLMVRKGCMEGVGPLDPYLYFYWEEADFCRRARYQRWRVVLVPKALARHYAGGWSSGNPENMVTANQLQCRNYYIYKLANPFQNFLRNLAEVSHLFLVNTKSCFRRKPLIFKFHVQILGGVLRELPVIYQKWVRDRQGGHPPPIARDILGCDVKVFQRRDSEF